MVTRRERVVVSYDSDLTTGAARDAAALALLAQRADDADSSVRRTGTTMTQTGSKARALGNDIDRPNRALLAFDKTVTTNRSTIDQYSGRLGLIRDALLAIGPAAIPVGAVAIPAVAGLVTQLGFLATAGGVSVLGFQGVGDALKAIEKARIEPTVENLRAAQEAVDGLAPGMQRLVEHLQELRDEGRSLQFAAGDALGAGIDEALTSLEQRLPQARRIIREISDATGDEIAQGAESLASDRWDEFFRFLETQARPNLDAMATSVGNLSHGLANLLVGTVPLQDRFNTWLVSSTESFDQWADRMDEDPGYQAFLEYVDEHGPEVEETLGAILNMFVQVTQAAAPLGGPVLNSLEAVADVISAIADSDMGTPIFTALAALSLYNRGQRVTSALFDTAWGSRAQGSVKGMAAAYTTVISAQDRARMSSAQLAAAEKKRQAAVSSGLKTLGRGAAVAGALAIAGSGVADNLGLANTATLALAGSMAGPWGAAVGAGVGLLMDYRAGQAAAAEQAHEFASALDQQTGAMTAANEELIYNELSSAGAYDAAKSLGVSLDLVTQAALGNKDAVAELNDELDRHDRSVEDKVAPDRPRKAWTDEAKAVETLKDALSGTSDIIREGTAEYEQHAAATAQSTNANRDLEHATTAVADATADLRGELAQLAAFFDKRAAYRAYQESLDGIRKSLKDTPHAFSEFNARGRQNLELLDQLTTNAIQFADTMTNDRNRGRFLNSVRRDLLQIAKTSPEARAAVRDILPALDEVRAANKEVVIRADNRDAIRKATGAGEAISLVGRMRPVAVLRANGTQAITEAQRVKNALDAIDRTIEVTVRMRQLGSAGVGPGRTDEIQRAAGGYVAGPGGPTDDQIPAWLSNGEFVMRAAAVQKYGLHMMQRLNAMRFADGGEVRSRAAGRAARAGAARITVGIGGAMAVSGTLQTPWGPAVIAGIARDVAREEISAESQFQYDHGGGS